MFSCWFEVSASVEAGVDDLCVAGRFCKILSMSCLSLLCLQSLISQPKRSAFEPECHFLP